MGILVTKTTFNTIIPKLVDECTQAKLVGFDTETTGLQWVDRMFSMQIATPNEVYYFNFNSCKDAEGGSFTIDETLTREHLKYMQVWMFSNPGITWAIQNAIYDLTMMSKEGITIVGPIHCTRAAAKTIYNEHFGYGLDALMKREFGEAKNDKVKEYLSGHHHLAAEVQKKNTSLKNRIKTREKNLAMQQKLYADCILENSLSISVLICDLELEIKDLETQLIPRPLPLNKKVSIPGKKGQVTKPFYFRVPKEIIVPYGCEDADQVRRLALSQLEALEKRPIWAVEKELATICTDMMATGLKIDKQYTEKAFSNELILKEKAEIEFKNMTGLVFTDSAKVLVPAFEKFNLPYPLTKLGNPSFKAELLERINHPLAEQILSIRQHGKNIGTYYSSFLYLTDNNGMLHSTPNPDIPRTGRFSYSGPNLQNVPKEAEEGKEFYMRKCFVPPSDDYVMFMPDYDQQEFKMMLDYAGETELIKRVLAGEDLHDVTANLVGCTRSEAKTLNYGLLYGMGVNLLATKLGVDLQTAKRLKADYFRSLPKVKEFIRTCTQVAEGQGFLRSWAGRIFFYPDINFAYKGANSVIQGGCADVLKIAMIRLYELLKPYKTHMVLQVHDELMFNLHVDELYLAPQIVKVMEEVYTPMNGMPLTCSASWSAKSWGYCDKVDGYPTIEQISLDNSRKVG